MRRRRPSLVLLALAPLAIPAPAPQDAGSPPAEDPAPIDVEALERLMEENRRRLEEGRRQMEEAKRGLAAMRDATVEMALRAEAQLARLGSSEPWPPEDPAFGSAAAWREAVLGAEALAPAGLLGRFERVRLSVSRTPQVSELFPDDTDLLTEVARAVFAAGKRTHPDAPVALEVALSLSQTSLPPTDGGAPEELHLLACTASLVVPARTLREGAMRHASLTVDRFPAFDVGPGFLGPAELSAAIDAAVRGLFAALARAQDAPAASRWSALLADAGRADALHAAFAASRREAAQLGAGLEDAAAAGELRVAVSGAEGLPVGEAPGGDELGALWAARLPARGLALGAAGAPALRHELCYATGAGLRCAPWFAFVSSRVSVREEDCLAVLDGALLRLSGDTLSAERLAFVLPGGVRDEVLGLLDRSLADVLDGFGRLGPPPLPPHPDADAVARTLRSKARLPLEDEVVVALANRIAHGLEGPGIPAGMRREWIVANGGERWYQLVWAGQARDARSVPPSVREAIDRAIDGMVRDDPLSFWAFEDLWSAGRGYPVELPPDYAAVYLAARRPSGPGALRSVQVLDAAEWARRRMLRDSDVPRAAHERLDALRETLRGARVLACEYIPPGGEMNLTHARAFWHGAPPPGWSEIAPGLPPGIALDRVGPPQESAPRTLEAAERVLAAAGIR